MEYDVTIGIPVYNVEKYIRMALESALAQTFPSIEFLVLDDCGTDASMDIVRDLQSRHPRGGDIRIVSQPQNMGIGEARNKILDTASGKFLYFMDADDAIEANTIELLYDNAIRYKADIVYGSYERIETYGDEVKRMLFRFESKQFLQENAFASWAYDAYANLPAMVWNLLIDINLFRKNALRFPSVSYWEDFALTTDLPTYVHRAVLLPDITYHYYCRVNSASNFQKRSCIEKKEIEDVISAMAIVKRNSHRIANKPYFHKRMLKVMKTHFFMCQSILRNRSLISPSFTASEIREIMRSPLSFTETLMLKGLRTNNLFFYSFGMLPPTVSVALMKITLFHSRYCKI